MKEVSAALLAPGQLGFWIAGGAESAVRAARRYIDNMMLGQVFVKIDFNNAFNTLRRDWKQSPSTFHSCSLLLAFAQSTIGHSYAYYNSVTSCYSLLQVHNKVTLSGRYSLPGIQRTVGVSTIRTRPCILRRRGCWWQCEAAAKQHCL